VYSYAVKSIVDLSRTEGAYLNALFWVGIMTRIVVIIMQAMECLVADESNILYNYMFDIPKGYFLLVFYCHVHQIQSQYFT